MKKLLTLVLFVVFSFSALSQIHVENGWNLGPVYANSLDSSATGNEYNGTSGEQLFKNYGMSKLVWSSKKWDILIFWDKTFSRRTIPDKISADFRLKQGVNFDSVNVKISLADSLHNFYLYASGNKKIDSNWYSVEFDLSFIKSILKVFSKVSLGFKIQTTDSSRYVGSSVLVKNLKGIDTTLGTSYIIDFGPTTGISEPKQIPSKFILEQNYPNPFNPSTTIKYSVPQSGEVSLKVYNLIGEEVATLSSGFLQAGNYTATFNGSNLASGVYFYRLQASNFVETKRLVLLK